MRDWNSLREKDKSVEIERESLKSLIMVEKSREFSITFFFYLFYFVE